MKFILSLLLFIHCGTLICFSQSEENYKYGLRFKSHLSNLDERTSLDLNPKGAFERLKEGFSISFDIKFRKEEQTFGYVFRMISEGQSSFDFLSNLKDNEFSFIINKGSNHIVSSQKVLAKDIFEADKWINVKVVFFKNRTDITIKNQLISLDKGIGSFENIKFYFGANKNKYFHTTEVPPIIIKNIRIVESDRLIRYWVLDKHNKEEVYDEIGQNLALVNNGIWDINQHLDWKKELSLQLESAPQLAYDNVGGKVFVVGDNVIYRYHTSTGQTDTIEVKGGNPYRGLSRQIIYDTNTDELISYTIQSPILSRFSFVKNSWSISSDLYIDSRQHHNHIFDKISNQLYVLNGYAYHQYSGDMMKLDLTNPNWQTINYNPIISPRYLSALGQLDSTHVLLLGGYGSKSGKQEEFPTNFYDLYKLDYKTGRNTKMWEISLDTSIVFSNSMYIDKKQEALYVLGYSNLFYKSSVSLYSFTLGKGKPVINQFESSIPFNFLDIESFSDLFYDKITNRLYALLSYKKADNVYEMSVYSIGFPVLNAADIRQEASSALSMFLILGCLLAIILLLFVYFLWKKFGSSFFKKRNIQRVDLAQATVSTVVYEESSVAQTSDLLEIRLFNGFEVIDREGRVCTANFTPILKNIFLCILLHTIRNREKGIASYDLNQAFWQGMTSDKALNNRSVNMRKLRIVLAAIGDIQIEHVNSQWRLIFNERMQCDYEIVLEILQSIDRDHIFTKERLNQIITLAKGKLLPGNEGEWLDTFKTEFNTLLIKVLNKFLSSQEFKEDQNLKIQIADVILLHDSLEENAIIYKCNLLYKLGQKGQSKRVFDKYCLEYEQILASKATIDYQEVIDLEL